MKVIWVKKLGQVAARYRAPRRRAMSAGAVLFPAAAAACEAFPLMGGAITADARFRPKA